MDVYGDSVYNYFYQRFKSIVLTPNLIDVRYVFATVDVIHITINVRHVFFVPTNDMFSVLMVVTMVSNSKRNIRNLALVDISNAWFLLALDVYFLDFVRSIVDVKITRVEENEEVSMTNVIVGLDGLRLAVETIVNIMAIDMFHVDIILVDMAIVDVHSIQVDFDIANVIVGFDDAVGFLLLV